MTNNQQQTIIDNVSGNYNQQRQSQTTMTMTNNNDNAKQQ